MKCCTEDTTGGPASNASSSTMTRASRRILTYSRRHDADASNASSPRPELTSSERKAKNKRANGSRRPAHQRAVIEEIAELLNRSYNSVNAEIRHCGFVLFLARNHTTIEASLERKALSGLGRPL